MDVFQGFELFLSICLILFGVLGNLLVFLGAYKEKSLRNVPCVFVLNLSACHLIVLLFPFLVFVVSFAVGEWPFSFAVCQWQAYVSYTLGTEVMMTMVLLSVNRYLRIVQPVKYRYIFSGRSTKCFIVVSWCVSFLVNIFALVGYGKYGFNNLNDPMCSLQASVSIHQVATGGVLVVIAVCVIVACYVKVFYAIRDFRRPFPNSVISQSSSFGNPPPRGNRVNRTKELRQEEVQLTITLFALVVLFVICWSPTAVSSTVNLIKDKPASHVVELVRVHALVLETVVDPVVYAIRNKRFRQVIKRSFQRQSWNRQVWAARGQT